jgi:hypothetical protein
VVPVGGGDDAVRIRFLATTLDGDIVIGPLDVDDWTASAGVRGWVTSLTFTGARWLGLASMIGGEIGCSAANCERRRFRASARHQPSDAARTRYRLDRRVTTRGGHGRRGRR